MSYLSDIKLKPCPLCGAAFLIAQEPYDNPPVAGMYYIFHDYGPLGSDARECPIDVSRHFNTREEAIAAWNRRPAEAERDDLLAKNGALASLEQGYADAADKAGKEKWVREGGLAKGQWQARAEAAAATIASLTAENEKLREVLLAIDTWAKAYPLRVFPEPDFVRVRELLARGGITVDAVSASNMRHVLNGIAGLVSAALSNPTEGGKDE